jgi:hypothetical protein
LTPRAIEWLSNLQEGNNSAIVNYRDVLGDIIAYFGCEIHNGDQQDENDIELKHFINELSYLRRDIKDLSKP